MEVPIQAAMDAGEGVGRFGGPKRAAISRQREIHACNFRLAAQLSKEDARNLTTLHEAFARIATIELSLHLAVTTEMKLVSLEQRGARDYIAGLSHSRYLLPYKIAPMGGAMIMEIDNDLLSSIIDILLGGSGAASTQERELTDLDEELIKSITAIIISRLELAWKSEGVVLVPQPSIKPALASRAFPPSDSEVLLLMFEVSVAGSTGSLNLVLSHSFAKFLLRSTQTAPSKRRVVDPNTLKQGLRDKVLECVFTTSMELPALSVAVRELIDLKSGSVLKLGFPVNQPAKLMIDQNALFEAIPVRDGSQRAAQLSDRIEAGVSELEVQK